MTDEEQAAAEGPAYLPGGRFMLLSGNVVLGRSALEWEYAGDGEWVREGVFEPSEAYFPFQPLIQRYSQASLCLAQDPPPPADLALFTGLQAEIAALDLRVVDHQGTVIPVASLELQDFAGHLDDEPRELSVIIRDRSVYEAYFSPRHSG